MWVRYLLVLMLFLLFIGAACSLGMGDSRDYDYLGTPIIIGSQVQQQTGDWINPYSAGRPDWDPYGPGYYPYASGSYSGSLQLQPADPSAEKLAVEGYLPYQNQLYLQRGPGLWLQGSVMLGEPFVLWAHLISGGVFTLCDRSQPILTQGYLRPGWYKIEGLFSNTLEARQYQFASAGILSNILMVSSGSGGYPTSYSLTGRVIDQYGSGISGAKVIISGGEGGYFSTKTDAFGYYGMNVATGSYIITAEKSGFKFTQSAANAWAGAVSAARDIIGYPLSGYAVGAKY